MLFSVFTFTHWTEFYDVSAETEADIKNEYYSLKLQDGVVGVASG